MRKRTIALLAGAVLISALVATIAWRSFVSREEALEESRMSSYLATLAYRRVKSEMQISEAMTISDVERILSDAWYHRVCGQTENWTAHMFFYGSHDLDRTGVVLVEIRKQEQREVITNVYTVQNYMLPGEGCLKGDPFLKRSE